MKKITVAICYDFDNTLSVMDMQNFSFIPNLGLTPAEFWSRANEFGKANKMDGVSTYLKFMIDLCKEKDIKLTRDYLVSLGKDVKYFNGVTTWFDRINKYAKSKDINLEHYIISSGNKEIIEGTEIFHEFKEVFGSEYLYNEEGIAYWPKTMINYTQKTQYLFRISKGAYDMSDDQKVNERIKRHHVEFRNMIYMGDGITDVPCLTLIKEKGGSSISIYKPGTKYKSDKLINEDRVNYACVGDFSEGSQVEVLTKLIIDSISTREKLLHKNYK